MAQRHRHHRPTTPNGAAHQGGSPAPTELDKARHDIAVARGITDARVALAETLAHETGNEHALLIAEQTKTLVGAIRELALDGRLWALEEDARP